MSLDQFISPIEEELRSNTKPSAPPPDPFRSAEQRPVIFEETTGIGERFRVLVVWDKWAELPNIEDRNRVILEAYRRVLGDTVRDVSLTLGITRQQFELMSPGSPQWFGVPG